MIEYMLIAIWIYLGQRYAYEIYKIDLIDSNITNNSERWTLLILALLVGTLFGPLPIIYDYIMLKIKQEIDLG